MRKFYSNVGKKIQLLSKICGIVGIMLVIVGLILVFEETVIGISLGISGIILLLSSLPLYAFGQIAEDVHEMRNRTSDTPSKIVNNLPEL